MTKTAIFYFDSVQPDPLDWDWVKADLMVDGDPDTYAEGDVDDLTQPLFSNTSPAAGLSPIRKVEIRARGEYSLEFEGPLSVLLTPVFVGGDGDGHNFPLTETPAYSEWFDITHDTNAPAVWTETELNNLDCKVKTLGACQLHLVSIVEIRVTYGGADITLNGTLILLGKLTCR